MFEKRKSLVKELKELKRQNKLLTKSIVKETLGHRRNLMDIRNKHSKEMYKKELELISSREGFNRFKNQWASLRVARRRLHTLACQEQTSMPIGIWQQIQHINDIIEKAGLFLKDNNEKIKKLVGE